MTSRNPECGPAHQTVGRMELDLLDLENGVELLHKAANVSEQSRYMCRAEARAVVEALGFHTLAILQAGAYIAGKYCTMADYPRVLKRHSKRLMQFHKTQEQARYRSAYATMEASMQTLESCPDEQASRDALDLLRLLSTLHHEQVPLGFFKSAVNGAERVQAANNPSEERLGCMNPWHVSQVPDFLKPESDLTWDSYRLNGALNLLVSLALVRRDGLDSNESMSMHPLTHAWARERQDSKLRNQSLRTSECVLALAKYGHDRWQPWWDRFGPHAQILIHADTHLGDQAAQSMCGLQMCYEIAQLLENLELLRDLDAFLQHILSRLGLDPEIPVENLLLLYNLVAVSATEQGNTKKAIRILERSTQVASATQDARSSETLWWQRGLASAYLHDGQARRAVNVLESIVQGRQFTSGQLSSHDQRLMEDTLAHAYLADGRFRDAIPLLKNIVLAEKQLLPNNPDRLASQKTLAEAYLDNDQTQEAVELLEYVVKVHNTSRAQTSREYLHSKHLLATAYLKKEQVSQAIELLEQVAEIGQTMFAESNPALLSSQHELARAYLRDNQIPQAIRLLEHVVAVERTTLEDDNQSRILSQTLLKDAYERLNGPPRSSLTSKDASTLPKGGVKASRVR